MELLNSHIIKNPFKEEFAVGDLQLVDIRFEK